MKAVLISVKPKWCELIASGKKTVEVRKTKPKIDVPFKCYIYCSQPKYPHEDFITVNAGTENAFSFYGGGKVIGEFICDEITPLAVKYFNPESYTALKEFPYICMTDKQIIDYLGNGIKAYGWHISNLKIYDKPKCLGDFRHCGVNYHFNPIVARPPQSWCYLKI